MHRQLDEAWFCALPDDVRVERLVQRHVAAGRDAAGARAFVLRSDEANAATVRPTEAGADLVLVDGHVVHHPAGDGRDED